MSENDELSKKLRAMKLPPGYNACLLLDAAKLIEQQQADAQRIRDERGRLRTAIVYRPDGSFVEADTKGELRAVLGVEPVQLGEPFAWPDNSCLCPCDMEATAHAADMSVHCESGMEWIFRPAQEAQT